MNSIACTLIIFHADTCDLNWQRPRNGLIISAFVFSVFPFTLDVILVIFLSVTGICEAIYERMNKTILLLSFDVVASRLLTGMVSKPL